MFRLFQSIFGKNDAPPGGLLSDSLVQAAIERAVDGTDLRMRILPGYAKKLREPVVHAIGHVIALVQRLVPPVEATASAREHSPALSAVFTSATRTTET